MTRSCSKCHANLDTHWDFCPHCGGEGVVDAPQPEQHDKAPANFAFTGLMLGLFTAPVFVIYGTLMCLLGPPMVLGIPLIILGLAAPFAGPYLAMNAVRGKCPWCGTKIASVGLINRFYCHACSQPIEVRNHELSKGVAALPAR